MGNFPEVWSFNSKLNYIVECYLVAKQNNWQFLWVCINILDKGYFSFQDADVDPRNRGRTQYDLYGPTWVHK